MEPPASPSPTHRPRRCWRVPPPLTRGSELLEGAEVLAEIPGDEALLLWKSMRNVTLWADASPRERAGLFTGRAKQRRLAEIEGAALEPALSAPLRTVAVILGNPPVVDRAEIARACRSIAHWAEARGASATALTFMQTAAQASPEDAQLAFLVGRLARGRAENARSESWFRRAIMLARQTGDWESYANAYLGLGNLFIQRGSLPLARRAHVKGLRAAKRHGMREVAARALHDLMVVESESGNPQRSQEHAAAALRAYGPRHPRLPALAHDTACLWASQGDFSLALPVFQAVLPHMQAARERVLVLSNLARAAGGCGRADVYETAWRELHDAADGEAPPQALLNLARGASLLGDRERAEASLQRAIRGAAERGEAQIRLEAEALADAVLRRGALPDAAEPAAAADPAAGERASALAGRFVRSLRPAAAGV